MSTEHRREIVRKSQARRRAKLKANGLCVQCGKPTDGKTVCADCMKKLTIANKRYRERKDDI